MVKNTKNKMMQVRRTFFALGFIAIIVFFLIPTVDSVRKKYVDIFWLIYPVTIIATWTVFWLLDEKKNQRQK